MVILKTISMAFGLFGMMSMTATETVVPDMPQCVAYLKIESTRYEGLKIKSELKNNGKFLTQDIEGWPNRALLVRECIEVKVE